MDGSRSIRRVPRARPECRAGQECDAEVRGLPCARTQDASSTALRTLARRASCNSGVLPSVGWLHALWTFKVRTNWRGFVQHEHCSPPAPIGTCQCQPWCRKAAGSTRFRKRNRTHRAVHQRRHTATDQRRTASAAATSRYSDTLFRQREESLSARQECRLRPPARECGGLRRQDLRRK